MDKNIRRQLTLFVPKTDAVEIERIRKKFNSRQQLLIHSHVTLCREHEIENIEKVLDNLENVKMSKIAVQFGQVTRFENNKGVLLRASGDNAPFHQLREKVLNTSFKCGCGYEPHITLLHPGNSTCTDEIFEEIELVKLPTYLTFDTVSLIKQIDKGQWQILKTFKLNHCDV